MIVQIRIKRSMGGKYAKEAARCEKDITKAYRDYESKNGPYDLVKGNNWSVGEGKLLKIIRDLEARYGSGIMQRYFAAAKSSLGDEMRRRDMPLDRRVFVYFNHAAGEDLTDYFRSLGISVQ